MTYTSNESIRAGNSAASCGVPWFWDRAATGLAIPFGPLVDALALAARQHSQGEIHSPERIGVPLAGDGISLSMPASATDIAIHKLVNVQPGNAAQGLPTIHGVVTVSDARSGRPIGFLDGPELTGRRTAGISLLGIRSLLGCPPEKVLLIGTGVQASYHVKGLHEIYPQCRILVKGSDRDSEKSFCEAHAAIHEWIEPAPANAGDIQVVITLTTSKQIVYDEPASPDRLVIGVGAFKPDMAEIGAVTLGGSVIYADDPSGARHEAGDLLRANVDWALVKPLAEALSAPAGGQAKVLKSVGTAAWDLAAARVALGHLSK
jgi:1-piperideine-2-carboxylate/1-pyrroline-2-carboxylate reductase [NAD(P)H]